ncbi:MAG: DUF1553 domain-containing protein [Verrucomicrobiales bacterium]|nr:DUF1553 domain-containing protein [Verrucomicrobiales bacterium]
MAFFNSTAESPMDGNAYVYAPVIEAPGSVSDWYRWEKLTAERDALLTKIDEQVDEEKAVAFAKSTAGWKTENWKISKAVAKNAEMPATDEKDAWKELKGLPGASGEKFGNGDQVRWISFDLTTETRQALVLETNGSGSSSGEFLGKPVNVQHSKLTIEPGTHRIVLRLNNGDRRARVSVKLMNPWEPLTKAKWADCSEDARLEMAADPLGGLFSGEMQKAATELQAKVAEVKRNFSTTLVAKDLPQPRETKLLHRGEYDQPEGEPVTPGVFAVMNPMPEGAPRNRLGLAKWAVSRENPLVSRVLVNRVWQSIFGYGLVRSPEDFGLQGRYPTHPQLLDWLAVEFQESSWDFKHLIRKMVMSETFRQDSAWRSGVKDPQNELLARGPSFRLDAEVIRDVGLWSGGLLRDEAGGEGVKPWQPEGMWIALAHPASNTKSYVPDTDERINRRSLYVYWKRTSPHPMMTLFDAPSRESACVRRSRGNTPLQSLGLLNEPQRLEMARALAARIVKSTDEESARLDGLFELLICRKPGEAERAACVDLLKKATERYTSNQADAEKLLAVNENQLPPEELAEMAAWTQMASTMLASDMAILLY